MRRLQHMTLHLILGVVAALTLVPAERMARQAPTTRINIRSPCFLRIVVNDLIPDLPFDIVLVHRYAWLVSTMDQRR